LKVVGKQHKLLSLFEDFETKTTFRNYCAHWKNEATPFTTSEISMIFNKWLEIENAVYCYSCKSFCNQESSGRAIRRILNLSFNIWMNCLRKKIIKYPVNLSDLKHPRRRAEFGKVPISNLWHRHTSFGP
jgi:hypothetical protein